MIARRPPAAVNTFKDWLQQAVSCVTSTVITVSPNGYQPSDTPHQFSLGDGTSVPLTARSSTGVTQFGLSVLHAYRIVRPGGRRAWKVQTAAYQYALDDVDGREIFAYHWHPHIENVPYPHLHINRGAIRRDLDGIRLAVSQNPLIQPIADAHLPTRRIALEDVLRLILEQFHVRPARGDWDAVLRRTRQAFAENRTWL